MSIGSYAVIEHLADEGGSQSKFEFENLQLYELNLRLLPEEDDPGSNKLNRQKEQ